MAVTDKAITKIKEMILNGELRAGDRLPPEMELAERLGLSRNSLREAVKALEVIKVLDVRRGDGTYVTSLEPQLLTEALSFIVDLHHDSSVLEVFEVRRILEPAAAALAAARITSDQLAALQQAMESATATTPVEDLVVHDLRFHAIIAEAAGNAYLASLLDGLSSRTARARIWRGLTQAGAVRSTLTEHRDIVEALRAGDAALTAELLTSHIGGVEQWLRQAAETRR